MARLAERDLRGVRELQHELAVYVDGGPPALARAISPLRDLLATEVALAYNAAPRGDGLRVEWTFERGMSKPRFGDALDRWLEDKIVGWTNYNPLHPEPWQRNRVLGLAQIY